jgi:hypothetical protein
MSVLETLLSCHWCGSTIEPGDHVTRLVPSVVADVTAARRLTMRPVPECLPCCESLGPSWHWQSWVWGGLLVPVATGGEAQS